MSQIFILSKTADEIERPVCADCSVPMWLVRVSPHGEHSEARLFSCPVCDREFAGPAASEKS